MASMRNIVVVGSLNVDISVQASRIPRPGESVRATDRVLGPGGKGLNQCIAASRLGGRVHMVGRLGDDEFAEIPERALADADVDTSGVARLAGSSTGLALIVVDRQSGQNTVTVDAGANREVTPENVLDAIGAFRASGVLLVQLELPVETVETALDLAKQHHLTTILDPAPARELPDALLRRVDVLLPNELEAEALTGIVVEDVESAAAAGGRLRERTQGDVFVTMGAQGCVWVSPTGFEAIPTTKVTPVDTTGAGDAFAGGLAVGLARGQSLAHAVRLALEVGTASTLQRGAMWS